MNSKVITTKGDGATCAHCGATPETRYAFDSRNWLTLVWACNEDHSEKARFN